MHTQPSDRQRHHRNQRNGRVTANDPLAEIRTVIRATMRLSVDKLVQLGYARDGAKALLLSMTRGIMGHLDDQQAKDRLSAAKPTRSGEPG